MLQQGTHHQGALYSAYSNGSIVSIGHDRTRTITVILARHCVKLPDDGSLVIRNTLEHF